MNPDSTSLWRDLAAQARPDWPASAETEPAPGFVTRAVAAAQPAPAVGALPVPGPLAWRAVGAAFLLSAAAFGLEVATSGTTDRPLFPEPASAQLP